MKNITIIGLGMMGGSLARALKTANPNHYITAMDTNQDDLSAAKQNHWIDQASKTIPNSDIIFICTPLGQYEKLIAQLPKDAIVSDIGSCKKQVVKLTKGMKNFVPGHPVAGLEKSGVHASNGNLFQDAKVILTPTDETNTEAVKLISELWQSLGANIEVMDAEKHDHIFARTSHLPQLLSYALMLSIEDQLLPYSGKGFKDMVRLAGSSPEMWHDVCLQNKTETLKALDTFSKKLNAVRYAIDNNENVFELFQKAKDKKKAQ